MLVKLLKHNLKDLFKNLIVFYTISVFFALLTRIFFTIENSIIMDVIAKICSGVTISMIFNILVNNTIRVWVRFKQNLYGDESYLTHTLPVKKHTLYLSKMLGMVITLFVSTAVIALTLFIAYYSKENIQMLKQILLPVADAYGSTIVGMILAFLFIVFLEIANAVVSGFIGIILGHRMNSGKAGFSILFGFIAYMVTQTAILAMMFGVALFNQDIMNLFVTTEMMSVDLVKNVIYMAIGLYSITLTAGYFIGYKLFKKGVNVD